MLFYLKNLKRSWVEALGLLHDLALGLIEDVILGLVDGQDVVGDLLGEVLGSSIWLLHFAVSQVARDVCCDRLEVPGVGTKEGC